MATETNASLPPRRPRFHRYAQHQHAWCFWCQGRLIPETTREDGYPPGHGEFSAQCAVCGLRTWYDVGEAR